jgi:elongation factor Ts
MEISLEAIKVLRERSGAGVVESKQALVEAEGNLEKAIELLRKKGQATALKKQDRATKEGVIGSYIHPNLKVASLIEVSCETDFVARTDAFQDFAHNLAMQVAATNPAYLRPEDIPADVLQHERTIISESEDMAGKPAAVVEKIIEGRLEKYFRDVCFLKQAFIKDDSLTIEQLVTDAVTKFGENIQLGRFTRFQL